MKWGMGSYLHNGRIIVKTQTEPGIIKKKREFNVILQREISFLNRLRKSKGVKI